MSDIAVIYQARGADPNWQKRIERFRHSYCTHPAGVPHTLYTIYKNFETDDDLKWAISTMGAISEGIYDFKDVNSFAAGTFAEAAGVLCEPVVCFFGSSTEIMHDNYLAHLFGAWQLPTVGVTCCTGSYGRITEFFPDLPYPNPHIRNLSFMIDKEFFQRMVDGKQFNSKLDDLEFEHGPDSLTRRIMRAGKIPLVVEANRIRASHEWGDTTYRGNLHNVLVHDRGARDYHGDL